MLFDRLFRRSALPRPKPAAVPMPAISSPGAVPAETEEEREADTVYFMRICGRAVPVRFVGVPRAVFLPDNRRSRPPSRSAASGPVTILLP
jgi:hypothetical protein